MTEPKLILPLYPVTDITIGPLPEHRMIVLRPDFLAPLTPSLSQSQSQTVNSKQTANKRHAARATPVAQQGRTYVLSRSQARYLQEQLQRSLQILDAELNEHTGAQPTSSRPAPFTDQSRD